MSNLKNSPQDNFTEIPNILIFDNDLSWLAIALYCVLACLLRIPDFVPCLPVMSRCCGVCDRCVEAALRELRKHGYLVMYKSPGPNGWNWCYRLYALPLSEDKRHLEVINAKPGSISSAYLEPISSYTAIPNDVILCGDIKPGAKVIFFCIAALITIPDYTFHTWDIANRRECNVQTVRRYMRILYDFGLAKKSKGNSDATGHITHDYEISFESAKVQSSLTQNMVTKVLSMNEKTADEKTADEKTADEKAADEIFATYNKTNSNKPLLNKPNINHCKIDTVQEEIIRTQCEWRPDRYDNADEQRVYNLVISGIVRLHFEKNSKAAKIIKEHLAADDYYLCKVATQVAEDCYWQIFCSDAKIETPEAYIAKAIRAGITVEEGRKEGRDGYIDKKANV